MSNIKENLSLLREKIEKAAHKAGRDPSDITLVAVSKYATIAQIQEAYDLGLRVFAESRLQDALEKKTSLPKDIQWHFIGRIQSNKLNKIIGEFSLIHSISDVFTAQAIAERSLERSVTQQILLQVNVSKEKTKQGFDEKELQDEYPLLSSFQGISIQGLMTMGPQTDDRTEIRKCFSELRVLKESFVSNRAPLAHLSMGMSGDFEMAIEEGASLVRIGSALFH